MVSLYKVMKNEGFWTLDDPVSLPQRFPSVGTLFLTFLTKNIFQLFLISKIFRDASSIWSKNPPPQLVSFLHATVWMPIVNRVYSVMDFFAGLTHFEPKSRANFNYIPNTLV